MLYHCLQLSTPVWGRLEALKVPEPLSVRVNGTHTGHTAREIPSSSWLRAGAGEADSESRERYIFCGNKKVVLTETDRQEPECHSIRFVSSNQTDTGADITLKLLHSHMTVDYPCTTDFTITLNQTTYPHIPPIVEFMITTKLRKYKEHMLVNPLVSIVFIPYCWIPGYSLLFTIRERQIAQLAIWLLVRFFLFYSITFFSLLCPILMRWLYSHSRVFILIIYYGGDYLRLFQERNEGNLCTSSLPMQHQSTTHVGKQTVVT